MANNLITQELDFDQIKSELINFLKQQDEFKDYEYTGSAMQILIDTLAYNTHYMGWFAHMLANESMIESILRKENMNSKAKFLNYIPKSKKASKALVTITKPDPSPDTRVKVERGTAYQAKSGIAGVQDLRTFILSDDLFIYYNSETSDFTSDDVVLYEGEYRIKEFYTSEEQRYVIQDTDIDTDTIRVRLKESKDATGGSTYTQATDFNLIDGDSTVYFLTLNENDYYELTFGDDVYGKKLPYGSYLEVTYIATNGELGNGVTAFESTEITMVEDSTDGVENETLEDLRHAIPYHYRRQNRLVTVDDFKNIVLSEYKNVSSVNVWGGEDNIPKAYGKVYVCVKPLYGEELSNQAEKNLLNMLKKYTMATVEPIIVKPEYLYIDLVVNVKNDPFKTDKRLGELRTLVDNTIEEYNTTQLNKFDSYYSDVKLNTKIMSQSPSFITTYNEITLEKRFEPIPFSNQTYFVYFQNPVEMGSIWSTNFNYRNYECKLVDDRKGNIVVYYYDSIQKTYIEFTNEIFGEIDYETGIIKLTDIIFQNQTSDHVKIYAKPVKPLFFSKLNSVITIDNVEIKIEDYSGTESEK